LRPGAPSFKRPYSKEPAGAAGAAVLSATH
jgi:hypothetical protein